MIFLFCLNHGFQYIPFTAVSRVKTMCLSLMFLMFSYFKFRNLANRVCFYSDWYSGLNYWFLLAFFTFESQEANDFYLLALFPCIAFILKNIYSLQCHPFHFCLLNSEYLGWISGDHLSLEVFSLKVAKAWSSQS